MHGGRFGQSIDFRRRKGVAVWRWGRWLYVGCGEIIPRRKARADPRIRVHEGGSEDGKRSGPDRGMKIPSRSRGPLLDGTGPSSLLYVNRSFSAPSHGNM